jgi:predicted nucleic acid-binding protein
VILVDKSVWVHHLRNGLRPLEELLLAGEVLMHPFVEGEIACGSLRNRREILRHVGQLPRASVAEHSEVLTLTERVKLYALGIGWIDAHLLGSAMLSRSPLWSHDRRLDALASRLKVGYSSLIG